MANKHLWVEAQITPISVEFDGQDNMSVFATETALEISTEDRQYFCWVCSAPCNSDTDKVECPGQLSEAGQKG